MLVRAPLTYSATILRPRKQRSETVLYRGHLDVEVREATEAQAPVVLAGIPGSFHDLPEHRHFDGGLWKPLGTDLRGNDASPPSRAALLDDGTGDAPEWGHPLHRANGSSSRIPDALRFDRDALVREVLSTDLEEVAGMVREAARETLIVGDVLWERAEEPVYEVHRSVNGDHVTVTTFSRGRDQYRLDQGGWIDLVEEHGRGDDFAAPEVTVLRPDLLASRTTEHSVARVAEQLVASMGRHLKEGSAGDLAAYAGFRDTARAFAREADAGGRPDLPAFADALREGAATLSRLRGNEDAHDMRWADRAVRRIGLETGLTNEASLSSLRL